LFSYYFMILLYLFLAFLLYKFIFGFLLPVYRTTRRMKQGFREMQERMQQNMNAEADPRPNPKTKQNDRKGDYIDFEEVKD
jgi:hypothetical protein